MISPLGNSRLTIISGCLSFFVKGHHHHCGTQSAQLAGMFQEFLFAILQTDGVDDALTLGILQTGEHCRPIGRVNHQRTSRYGRVIGDIAYKGLHLTATV